MHFGHRQMDRQTDTDIVASARDVYISLHLALKTPHFPIHHWSSSAEFGITGYYDPDSGLFVYTWREGRIYTPLMHQCTHNHSMCSQQ